MAVSTVNDVQIFNLSYGRAIPDVRSFSPIEFSKYSFFWIFQMKYFEKLK